jgi:hypothetical protein
MLWHWLTLSKFFNKIGNYFYSLHVKKVHENQRKEKDMPSGKGSYGSKVGRPPKKKKKMMKKKKK